MTVRMGYDIAMTVSERYDAPVKIRRRNDIRVKRQTYNKTVTFYSDRKEKQ
jgi:hypothetical protein